MRKNNNLRNERRRARKSLSNPNTQREAKGWVKGASVLTSLIASGAIMYGATTTLPANAISIPGIQSFMGSIKSVFQADAFLIATQLQVAQTAQSAADINKKMIDAEFKKAATITGEAQGRQLAEIHMEMQPGRGISQDFTCIPQAERTAVVSKGVLSKNASSNLMKLAVSGYSESTTDKRAKRAFDHLSYFCDLSEVAQGICLPLPNGMGGADSNYSVIANTPVLNEDAEHAAYAFMLNVTDPSTTPLDQCDSHACDAIKTTNRVYQALSSMSQNAFINQINDAKVLTFSEEQQKEDDALEVSVQGLPEACKAFVKQVALGNKKHPDALISYDALAEEIRNKYATYSEADKKEAEKVCEIKTKEVVEVIEREDAAHAEKVRKAGETKNPEDGTANNSGATTPATGGTTTPAPAQPAAKGTEAKK